MAILIKKFFFLLFLHSSPPVNQNNFFIYLKAKQDETFKFDTKLFNKQAFLDSLLSQRDLYHVLIRDKD